MGHRHGGMTEPKRGCAWERAGRESAADQAARRASALEEAVQPDARQHGQKKAGQENKLRVPTEFVEAGHKRIKEVEQGGVRAQGQDQGKKHEGNGKTAQACRAASGAEDGENQT